MHQLNIKSFLGLFLIIVLIGLALSTNNFQNTTLLAPSIIIIVALTSRQLSNLNNHE